MANPPTLLGPDGAPVPRELVQHVRQQGGGGMRAGLQGGLGGYVYPYDAASYTSQELGDWFPQIRSPDAEINLYRDRMVARHRDLYRNDGWARGAIGNILDSTIGASYRRIAKPDHRFLSLFARGFDRVWAKEYGRAQEALWREYSEDLGHYNDVTRQLTVAQQFRLCLGHKLVDGESVILPYWLPDRIGRGAARYATAFLGIDPDRLSNPYEQQDTKYLRGGVEIDDLGARQAAWFRKAQPNDWYNAAESMQWERVPFEDEDGFVRVIHDFDRDRFGQHRGVSVFAPVLARLKMLARYYGVTLQAANVASAFGMFVTSPFDADLVQDALLGPGEDRGGGLTAYQDLRTAFHEKHKLTVNGVRIPTLAPGEKIETVAASQPMGEFSPFAHEMLRTLAAVTGQSETQVHKDLSSANYSSIRAGLVDAEKTFVRRCDEFNSNTADPVHACWLREVHERKLLPLPRNAPDFLEARTAYAKGIWLGVAAGWVDPVAERQGVILGLDGCLSTLERECARQGLDMEEVLDERAEELEMMRERKIPPPQWAGDVYSTAARPRDGRDDRPRHDRQAA